VGLEVASQDSASRFSHYVLNRAGAKWTTDKLRLTVRRLSEEGIIEQGFHDRAPRQPASERQMGLVHAIATAAPEKTLGQIAAQLEAMRERTPRGGTRWTATGAERIFADKSPA
jgi:hypothetical protein